MTLGRVGKVLGSQADFLGLHVSSCGVRMNEPGFHGLMTHGWVETAAQAVKCGKKERGRGSRAIIGRTLSWLSPLFTAFRD